MCGIVGYIGKGNAKEVLLDGLSKLEYRGYDSAGISVLDGKITTVKAKGQLKNLAEKCRGVKLDGSVGIGHTRWATHGAPSFANAHPHISADGRFAVVHNGIIENYIALRDSLKKDGVQFASETDTEVIPQLIAKYYKGDFFEAVSKAVSKLEGSYALGIVCTDFPDTLIAVRKFSPLIIGLSKEANYIASDVTAIVSHTRDILYIEDGEIAVLTPNGVKLYDGDKNELHRDPAVISWDVAAAEKGGYDHFMLKEIHEQPDVIRNVLNGKLFDIDEPIVLDEVKIDKETLKNLNRIEIIACGTSLHAAMVGKFLIEDFTGIAVDVEASSEYIYRKTVTNEKTLVIGVSQSGETADTITAIRQAKDKGAHILIITNRPDSSMARYADSLIPVSAGIEISVAATKSYTAQVLSFYLLAIKLAEIKGTLSPEYMKNLKHELIQVPVKLEEILNNKEQIQKVAQKFANFRNFIFIARGINLPTALEGALKLKEISYINATGYPAGELKHGPIAMLDETMPVLSIMIPGGVTYDKILSNSEEAKARNARLIALTSSKDENLKDIFEEVITIPEIPEMLSPIVANVPCQLLAYYIAEFLGKDVDQPRNLAKSVTVE